MDEEPESIPWSAPGLLWRIEERRRYLPQPKQRKTLRQRLRERGLHWSTEIVVGTFIAVAIASLAAVLLATAGTGKLPGETLSGSGTGGASGAGAVTGSGGSGAGGSAGAGYGSGGSSGSGSSAGRPQASPTDAPALCFLGTHPRPCNR
jgi:hypothetical protein